MIAKPVASPAQPAAGRPFTVSFKVTRSDNGRPFLRGKMTGDPSIAGRVVQHTESFKGGTARVSLVVPASATGKTLRVAVAIRDGSTKASRVATYRVQGRPSVSVGDASVTEGNAGTTPLSFPVTLSAASTQPVSVTYATADGTATAPSDYADGERHRHLRPGRDVEDHLGRRRRRPRDRAGRGLSRSPSPAPWARRSPAPPRTEGSRTTTPRFPITVGAYKGIIEGNALFLDVVDRYVTHFRSNYVRMDCGSTGIYVYGDLDWGDSRFTIRPDGSFSASADSTGTVSGNPAKFHDELSGRFDGTNVSGTVLGSVEYDRDGTHLSCTSGQRPWTASLQG